MLLSLYFFSASLFAQQKINVDVFVYHQKPPFIISHKEKRGLYFDFSTYLNQKCKKYHFTTVFVPRKRVDLMVEKADFDGVLLGVNPIWFKDKAEKKYLWTGNVYEDQDEVVSLTKNAIEYQGPKSLSSKVFGGVRGYYYYGINELVSKGEITRYDTIGERELLQMLLLGRIDVGIVSRSTLNYLIKAEHWQNQFYNSQAPHDRYQRRVLVPHSKQAIFNDINPIITQLASDPIWQEILEKY